MQVSLERGKIILLVSLFIILSSTIILGETAYFYWYDASGTLCKTTNAGSVEDGTTSDSDDPPYDEPTCCDVEGSVQVYYDTDCTSNCGTDPLGFTPAYTIDWDSDQVDCSCYGKTWLPEKFFESNLASCCGDDASEYYVAQGLGTACCNQGGVNVCVAASGRCRYEYNQETTCHDGKDNDCDGKVDCSDADCKSGTETDSCRDGINDDCDDYTDCSDPDCGISLDCIGCEPETDVTKCNDGRDNDCDNYVDCADTDCMTPCNCVPTVETCTGSQDEDCDGKIDCGDEDCFESCGGNCVTENIESGQQEGNCEDGLDNDCDSLIDHADRDCTGCGMNTKLCSDGSCKESCAPAEPQGCIGTANGNCEESEGCACEDCSGIRDSCERELICDTNDKNCKCPSGTTMCSDGRCRTKCFVCGNGKLEEGEECDGGTTTCPDGCTGGQVTCKADCTWDTSSCSCPQCDPTKVDNYCCAVQEDEKCDSECTANADSDCFGKCTFYSGDCCKDSKDGKCDTDCINYKDPDCSISCTSKKDNCCDVKASNGCDPDCDNGIDPDCGTCTNSEGDCCDNDQDNVCDADCIAGVDPDCKCGNGMIDAGETCDSANLDTKTCNNFFPGYGGLLACFNVNGEHACHFDTSGCHKIPDVCTGGSCTFGKDCRCPECLDQQSICGYGAVCDATARCACIDGTTLCKDGTCRTAQNCNDYDGGEQTCTGAANGVCDVGEGCGCPDCEEKKGPCNALSICQNGMCVGCFLKNAYWMNLKTEQVEDCIGSGNDIKLVADGLPGCEDKTITFAIEGVTLPVNKAVFKNGKAEVLWQAATRPGEESSKYSFKANLESDSDVIVSKELEVEYCIKGCDADCDNICETQKCVELNPDYCNNKEDAMEEGKFELDVNTMTGYCEECDEHGLSKGQETCAAYYDCTPGWWGDDANYDGAGTPAEARTFLEWGECGVPKVEPPGQLGEGRQSISGNMRNRLICPPDLKRQQCCIDQENCYCKLPGGDMVKKGLNCDLPEFRPTEIKACLAEEKFPFFTNMNVLIVVLILTGFYIWKTRRD